MTPRCRSWPSTRTSRSCGRSPRRSRSPARGSGTRWRLPWSSRTSQRVRLPYHLSALTQAAGLTALRHADEAAAGLDAIRAERDRIVRALSRDRRRDGLPLAGELRPVPAAGRCARSSGRALLDRGVLVRDLTEVVPNGLRVTAGTTHEVDLFLKALEEVLT